MSACCCLGPKFKASHVHARSCLYHWHRQALIRMLMSRCGSGQGLQSSAGECGAVCAGRVNATSRHSGAVAEQADSSGSRAAPCHLCHPQVSTLLHRLITSFGSPGQAHTNSTGGCAIVQSNLAPSRRQHASMHIATAVCMILYTKMLVQLIGTRHLRQYAHLYCICFL